MSKNRSIALVEDDPATQELLRQYLVSAGFDVKLFSEGLAAEKELLTQPYDLVLVDLTLPDTDGFTLTKRLLAHEHIGIIMVTAEGALESKLQGLEVGADAYLVKPVNQQELIATIQAVLRRIDRRHNGQPEHESWTLDPRSWLLYTPQQQPIQLTHNECLFLDALLRHPGELVSRRQIVSALGHSYEYYDTRRLEALVSRLRKKISSYIDGSQPIRTVHAKGYRFSHE